MFQGRTRKMAPEMAGAQSRKACRLEQQKSRTSSCEQQAESSACPLEDSVSKSKLRGSVCTL